MSLKKEFKKYKKIEMTPERARELNERGKNYNKKHAEKKKQGLVIPNSRGPKPGYKKKEERVVPKLQEGFGVKWIPKGWKGFNEEKIKKAGGDIEDLNEVQSKAEMYDEDDPFISTKKKPVHPIPDEELKIIYDTNENPDYEEDPTFDQNYDGSFESPRRVKKASDVKGFDQAQKEYESEIPGDKVKKRRGVNRSHIESINDVDPDAARDMDWLDYKKSNEQLDKAWMGWKKWNEQKEAKKKDKHPGVEVKLKEEDDYSEKNPNPKSKQSDKKAMEKTFGAGDEELYNELPIAPKPTIHPKALKPGMATDVVSEVDRDRDDYLHRNGRTVGIRDEEVVDSFDDQFTSKCPRCSGKMSVKDGLKGCDSCGYHNLKHAGTPVVKSVKTIKKGVKNMTDEQTIIEKAFKNFKKSAIQGATDDEVDRMSFKEYGKKKAMTDSERAKKSYEDARDKAKKKRAGKK